MSSAQMRSGDLQGQAEAKTEQCVQSAQNTANAAQDRVSESKESAQQGAEQSTGFLHQTGDQMMQMAHSAIDGVKNTLQGMGDNKKN